MVSFEELIFQIEALKDTNRLVTSDANFVLERHEECLFPMDANYTSKL
jgi:hypothetical protein